MASLPFSGLRARLVLLVLVAVLPALGLAAHAAVEERRAAGDRVRAGTLLLARLASAHHERRIELTEQFLATLSHLPEIRRAEPAACSALLARLVHQHPIYADVGLLSAGGEPVCSGLPALGAADTRELFRRVTETRSFAGGGLQTGGIPPRPTLAFGYPVFDEGNARRVVYALVDLAWLWEFAETAKVPPDSVLLLVDGGGTVLAAQPPDRRGLGLLTRTPVVATIPTTTGGGVREEIGGDGVRRLFAAAPLLTRAEGPPLSVAAGVPHDAAHAEAQRRLLRTLAAAGIAGLLGVLAAWFAGERFIAPAVEAAVRAATPELEAGKAEMDRTAAELRQSEARKGAILEGALDCVITMDETGRVVEFNPAAEKTFGYTREEAVGRAVDDLIVPARRRAEGEAALGGALAPGDGGALRRRVERLAMRADGTEFHVEVSITPIEGEGRPLNTAFLRDISERRQAEVALRGAHDELQKRVEARTAELEDANDRLVDWVEELQLRAQDMRLLAETGDHLQACHTVQEAYAVIAQ